MKIVVFGASGFVGGWICELLNECDDVELVACVRTWAAAARIARRGIEMVQVDLERPGNLVSLISGADAVINAAVPPSDREPTLAVRLYSACAEAGVGRFVQFSSAALYGDLSGEVREVIPPAPIDDYGRGKAEMEQQLLQAATQGGPQLFILRPSIIYGPFSDAWTVRYAKRIAKGRWRTLGNFGVGTCNLVHAQDVASAAILAATIEVQPGSHVLNINGPDVVSWNEYIKRFGNALGIGDRVTPSYIWMSGMVLGSEIIRKGGKFLLTRFKKSVRAMTQSGRTGPAAMAGAKSLVDLYPTLDEIRILRRRVRYSCDRAAKELKFTPKISLDDGLRQAANWCRTHGIV